MNVEQGVVNLSVAVISIVMGFFINVLWRSVKDLQSADTALSQKVAAVELLVAGDYVKRTDFDKMNDALFKKLDRIEDKLDGKADK